MFSVSELSEALARLIPCESTANASIRERFGWARRGGESYTYAFDVLGAGETRSFLLKALVPVVGTQTVLGATESYLQRNERVRASGIRVPHLHAVYNGTLLVDYIPLEAIERLRLLRRADRQQYDHLIGEIRLIVGRVLALGFQPTFGWSDFRLNRDAVYLVDLGVDLGSRIDDPGRRDVGDCDRIMVDLLNSV